MSQIVEIASNLRPIIFWLNVRTRGPQPSICVRTFSQFTTYIAGLKLAVLTITWCRGKPDTPPHSMRGVLGSSKRLANRHRWSICSGPLSPSVRRLPVGFRMPSGTCQGVVQNIERRIVIAIKDDPTTRADMGPHRERFLDAGPTC